MSFRKGGPRPAHAGAMLGVEELNRCGCWPGAGAWTLASGCHQDCEIAPVCFTHRSYLFPPPNPHNPTRLHPTQLTGLPQPFHISFSSAWMRSTAQTPHWGIKRHVPVPPVNGVPLSGQGKPGKRTCGLFICPIHERDTPSLCAVWWAAPRTGANITRAARSRGVRVLLVGCARSGEGREQPFGQPARAPTALPGEPSSRFWGLERTLEVWRSSTVVQSV